MRKIKCKVKKVMVRDEKLVIKILDDEIRLEDLPTNFRIANDEVYIPAFRVDRNISVKRYNEDLEILYNDIRSLSMKKDKLMGIYNNYCHMRSCCIDYKVEDDG